MDWLNRGVNPLLQFLQCPRAVAPGIFTDRSTKKARGNRAFEGKGLWVVRYFFFGSSNFTLGAGVAGAASATGETGLVAGWTGEDSGLAADTGETGDGSG